MVVLGRTSEFLAQDWPSSTIVSPRENGGKFVEEHNNSMAEVCEGSWGFDRIGEGVVSQIVEVGTGELVAETKLVEAAQIVLQS